LTVIFRTLGMFRSTALRSEGSRRAPSLILFALLSFFALSSSSCLVRQLGGAFEHEPEELETQASPEAKALIEQAFEGIDPKRLVDFHVHIVGIGTGDSGAWVNPNTRAGLHKERIAFWVYMSAAGIKNIQTADQEYVARLTRLARSSNRGSKYRILAFDKYYKPDASVDLQKTNFYMPNEEVFKIAQANPDIFEPVISVHPYRVDAVAELEKWARRGAKIVKWLPNAMGIDPSSPQLDSFYRKMKEHKMILLSHAGEEQAVNAEEDQKLGNPLRLRRALDHGVRVIVAHAASLGECEDLDSAEKSVKSCFDLFMRMIDEQKYEGLLFADISAMTQFNRMTVQFTTLLRRKSLHHRLVNGSDYPLPAINVLIHTRSLARDGFITPEERRALNEIYDYNPLLFDFVLKRTVRDPVSKETLSPSIFMMNPGLEN